jgi:hypothetical protein
MKQIIKKTTTTSKAEPYIEQNKYLKLLAVLFLSIWIL